MRSQQPAFFFVLLVSHEEPMSSLGGSGTPVGGPTVVRTLWRYNPPLKGGGFRSSASLLGFFIL
eukprot:5572110-Pyramimonas_sp.AAC.1